MGDGFRVAVKFEDGTEWIVAEFVFSLSEALDIQDELLGKVESGDWENVKFVSVERIDREEL